MGGVEKRNEEKNRERMVGKKNKKREKRVGKKRENEKKEKMEGSWKKQMRRGGDYWLQRTVVISLFQLFRVTFF